MGAVDLSLFRSVKEQTNCFNSYHHKSSWQVSLGLLVAVGETFVLVQVLHMYTAGRLACTYCARAFCISSAPASQRWFSWSFMPGCRASMSPSHDCANVEAHLSNWLCKAQQTSATFDENRGSFKLFFTSTLKRPFSFLNTACWTTTSPYYTIIKSTLFSCQWLGRVAFSKVRSQAECRIPNQVWQHLDSVNFFRRCIKPFSTFDATF